MLEFRNVSVSCQHMPILNDISLTFRDGEITTILGPNGCGKTTLVQCLNGASTVTAGQIFLNGQDFLKISPKERAREISLLPAYSTVEGTFVSVCKINVYFVYIFFYIKIIIMIKK